MRSDTVVPPALRALWRQRAEILAANVANGGREHREIAHAADLIRQDYHDRFLVELLQNANDQALVGGLRDSTVVIVRSEHTFAVSNGGRPVTARNLERLSSLADSDKTGVLVGNKGVGFKAVYQVTDAPEIYSASAQSPTASVFTDFGLGFALHQRPFEHQTLLTAVENDVRSFFSENIGIAQSLARQGIDEPLERIRPELLRVAGFKFPLARDLRDLEARLDELRIPDSERECIRTLVVLPLRDQQARNQVTHAIDRLVGDTRKSEPGQAELALLFLAGVARIVVIDHARRVQWTFSREITAGTPSVATVTVTSPTGIVRSSRFWLSQRDALSGDPATIQTRQLIVSESLVEFGLEAWSASDPLPVTIALPMPESLTVSGLGPPGRFCLGLPTQQHTGLPVHVDARFFATISRTGLDFTRYNALLLEVAVELLGDLLNILRDSTHIEDRRAVTLALQRTEGALADLAFSPGGIADGNVILAWGGTRFISRKICRFPSAAERSLLPYVCMVLTAQERSAGVLPEIGLIDHATNVLESLELTPMAAELHPWLQRDEHRESVIENAARLNRDAGPSFWEGFIASLLSCFEAESLEDQTWLPVGKDDLAAPIQLVFLPATTDTVDDDEVSSVPARVAQEIRLVDASAVRIREEGRGRTLTKLAERMEKARLVRSPRKDELLEKALFPALAKAANVDNDFAFELLAQAIIWINSMQDKTRNSLDCSAVHVPILDEQGRLEWSLASNCYVGEDWGLPAQHNRLLAVAFPGRRLVPLTLIQKKLGLSGDDCTRWQMAAYAMGVAAFPRIKKFAARTPPLTSHSGELHVTGDPTLGDPAIDVIYQPYVAYLAGHSTHWTQRFLHDVKEVLWVDGLEDPARREAIVDMILSNPEHYVQHCSTQLRRVGQQFSDSNVDSMWVFALRALDWPVLPGERGAGRESVRVNSKGLWRLPDGARRAAYAQILNVVHHALASASRLLGTLGVPSLEAAPLARLIEAVHELASRLDDERLHTRREAHSLAIELYAQINARLEQEKLEVAPQGLKLPLLRDRRLECVSPSETGVVVLFDDDPVRARHIDGIENAYLVPIARDSGIDRLHDFFVRTWGTKCIVRSSTAKVDVAFTAEAIPEPFLNWLGREFPHNDVAAELAALLTFGGERLLRAEPVSRHWKSFTSLTLEFGTFADAKLASFYDRANDRMSISSMLDKHDILAATWELAGARSRHLWTIYAQELRKGTTKAFLLENGIGDVEIIDVADKAGLNHALGLQWLAPALQAALCHFLPGTTLDDAAVRLSSIGNHPADVARFLGRPELEEAFATALGLRSPEGEIHLVRLLGVPWELWQEALLRRDGGRYLFAQSLQRFKRTRDHLVALIRELGARDANADLTALSAAISTLVSTPAPDSVQFLPPDVGNPDEAALVAVSAAVSSFGSVVRSLAYLPPLPWGDDLPLVPERTTLRGVRLFHDSPISARESEASTTVNAVLSVAERIAGSLGESVEKTSILTNQPLNSRMRGEWAHVYAALLLLRPLIEAKAPETAKRLSAASAFRESTTLVRLIRSFPDLPIDERETATPQPKQSVLGLEFTDSELRSDLLAGSAGTLGKMIAEAAARGIDPAILQSSRLSLPQPATGGKGTAGKSGSSSASTGRTRHEAETIGDLGEALVHEIFSLIEGLDYAPDCWVSKSRERYGFPVGNDGLGFDFRVPDPKGLIFGRPAASLHIEVKATSTDGSGAFPMSRAEWEEASRCHFEGDAAYVIVRVFHASTKPVIGDVIFDPFAAHTRGEIRLADRDLWVTAAPPQVIINMGGVK